MGLEGTNLVMIGLGIKDDSPPLISIQLSPLLDGVHLRWAFAPAVGFPWYGFYLFRRLHKKGSPLCLSKVTWNLHSGQLASTNLDTQFGRFESDTNINLTDDFPTSPLGGPGYVEFDLDGRKDLRFIFTPTEGPIRKIEASIGFRSEAQITVTGLLSDGTAVVQSDVSGQAVQTKQVNLEFDAMYAVKFSSGPAALIDLCFVPVYQDARNDWELVPNFTYPMRLPVTHPDYPCTQGMSEDLASARRLAHDRIRYGNPASYISQPIPIYSTGSVSVFTGSSIVIGNNTYWTRDLTGRIFYLIGDPTAYVIIAVVKPDKLVLSRAYTGPNRSALQYSINQDQFGQMHDYLIHLVKGGSSLGPMNTRNVPDPVYNSGFVSVRNGSSIVTGISTNWTTNMSDMILTILESPQMKYKIEHIDSPTQLTLDQPYAGVSSSPNQYNTYIIAARMQAEDGFRSVSIPFSSANILSLVILSSLQPAIAQLLGLYWIDQTAVPGTAYDYLIVADNNGTINFDPLGFLNRLRQEGFGNIDGYIVFNKTVAPASPLSPPSGLEVYALPGTTVRSQNDVMLNGDNNAGLIWNIPSNENAVLMADYSVLYHLWRADLGVDEPRVMPPENVYIPLTEKRPILVGKSVMNYMMPERPADWPPFPLNTIDSYIQDGWYSYKTSSIDIFGRHSPKSDPAVWYQWAPRPEPTPYYYQDGSAKIEIHPFAVHLLSKVPPTPPTGVEAYAIDPSDPTVQKDAAYTAWWNSLLTSQWYMDLSETDKNNLIGLRVRWQWTCAQMRQAPYTQEFRIYYQPGRMNSIPGRTLQVSSVSTTEAEVLTDIANTLPANAYTGAILQIGSTNYTITGSSANSPLQLSVRINDRTYNIGTVKVFNGLPSVLGSNTNWDTDVVGLIFKVDGENARYLILGFDTVEASSDLKIILDRNYEGPTGEGKTYTITGRKPVADTACIIVFQPFFTTGTISVENNSVIVRGNETNWGSELDGLSLRILCEQTKYTILNVGSSTQLTLDRPYEGVTHDRKHYTISHPLFIDYSEAINWQERYYVVGYNEHVTETVDRDGLPLRKYEVFIPAAGDAYYNGLPLYVSIFEPVVYANIGVTAADNKVHSLDAPKWSTGRWGNRYGNEGRVSVPAIIFRIWRIPPDRPDAAPEPDSPRIYATPADYFSRSYYTYRWVPARDPDHPEVILPLKCHIFRALDDAIFKIDWSQRPYRRITALDPADDTFFPPEWSMAKRRQVASELNMLNNFPRDSAGFEQAMEHYNMLSNDGLRVLAGLPGNERAFRQLTIQPLDPNDTANANKPGPDNPKDSQDPIFTNPNLRAYIDVLDGRSPYNRYFYRSAFVDAAHNRSSTLSLSSSPIWLPDLMPPATPRLLKALGGDRSVTLYWGANNESDVQRCLVYQTENREYARDIRLMNVVADLPAMQLAVINGEVDLGAGTDIAVAERVYEATTFDPSRDLFTGQSAAQYLASPLAPIGSRVTGLNVQDNTQIVVVYRDSKQALQHTPKGNSPRTWTDLGLVGARNYYYRIILTRKGETASGSVLLRSDPSGLVSARAIDLTPPDPPTITIIEWVRVGEDGSIHPYSEIYPDSEVRYSAVHLVWTSPDNQLRSLVQYSTENNGGYSNASGWLPVGRYEYIHINEFPFLGHQYRIKVMNQSGNSNIAFFPSTLEAAPD